MADVQNLGVSQPTVSHHLKKLREAGLIISERRGTRVYVRVTPGVLSDMARMLAPEDGSPNFVAPGRPELSASPSLRAAELTAAEAEHMALLFRALGEPVRLRLFSRVAARNRDRNATVADVQQLGLSQPTVSQHLKKLREAGLIISERRGIWVYVRVAPGVLSDMARMLAPEDGSRAGTPSPGETSDPTSYDLRLT